MDVNRVDHANGTACYENEYSKTVQYRGFSHEAVVLAMGGAKAGKFTILFSGDVHLHREGGTGDWFDKTDKLHADNVIVLRDGYNTIASYVKFLSRYGPGNRNIDQLENLNLHEKPPHNEIYKLVINLFIRWSALAEEAVHATNYFGNHTLILYNKWFTSMKYRQSICKKLGLHFTDKYFNRMSPEGHGSSFTDLKHKNDAQSLRTLKRYKELYVPLTFLRRTDDKLVQRFQELNLALFGIEPWRNE